MRERERERGMGEVGSTVLTCYKSFLFKRNGVKRGGLELKGNHLPLNPSKLQCREGKLTRSESRSPLVIKNQMTKPATYSSRISTDIPLYESPEASFDDYLEDKTRVVEAIFPDKRRSQRLNEIDNRDAIALSGQNLNYGEAGSIAVMVSNKAVVTTAVPTIIDMRVRCKSQGIGYPPGIPQDITKVVELDIIRWELQGLDDILKPSEFSLCVKGSFYPERRGAESQLKGQLQMDINFDLPPVVSWIPEDVRFRVVESGLKRLVENMKHKVNDSLLADYGEFKEEKLKAKFELLSASPVIDSESWN
ncbi:hypothetical protein RHGRI_028481 [Rhododendron griersonianum]|uniref:Uncharacterized protein n=1 Tax=Rhododendron griersonianum TaxID=479676 RepID=A0AAV6IJH4_9ERIC|nr:hypothetical protein RHGRI_028481 [Rhododendron griersonianum]